MNSFIITTFLATFAVAHAGLIGHGHSTVLQGPSSKTTLVGPDGSHISGHAPGGQVATTVDIGYAAHTGHFAPVVAHAASYVAHAEPYVAHDAPYVAQAGSFVAHASPIISHAVPAVAHSSIVRVDQIHSSPIITHAAPVLAHGILGHVEGSGLEGQYVHDYTETLYDDGSYKGEHYHH